MATAQRNRIFGGYQRKKSVTAENNMENDERKMA